MLTATQRRIGLGCALLFAIVMTVIGDDKSMPGDPTVRRPPEAADASSADARDKASRAGAAPQKSDRIELAKLDRVAPAAGGVDVFAPKSWAGPRVSRAPVQVEAAPPVAPPLPFQFVGRIRGREGPTILLSRDAESFSVKAGEPIDENYRLESISGETLTIVYLPLGERQILNTEPE